MVALRGSLIDLVDQEAREAESERGIIEESVSIRNCGSIVNAYIGAHAKVEGRHFLKTVVSAALQNTLSRLGTM